MFGSFNGSLTFIEIMVSLEKVRSRDGRSSLFISDSTRRAQLIDMMALHKNHSETHPVPQPRGGSAAIAAAWGHAAAFPTKYTASFDGDSRQFSFGWIFPPSASAAPAAGP